MFGIPVYSFFVCFILGHIGYFVVRWKYVLQCLQQNCIEHDVGPLVRRLGTIVRRMHPQCHPMGKWYPKDAPVDN